MPRTWNGAEPRRNRHETRFGSYPGRLFGEKQSSSVTFSTLTTVGSRRGLRTTMRRTLVSDRSTRRRPPRLIARVNTAAMRRILVAAAERLAGNNQARAQPCSTGAKEFGFRRWFKRSGMNEGSKGASS